MKAAFFNYLVGQRSLPIRLKLAAVITFLIAAISLFIFVYFPARLEKQAKAAIAAKAKSIAEMSAFSISPALFFGDHESIDEVIKSAKQNEDLAYLFVLDEMGHIVASFENGSAVPTRSDIAKRTPHTSLNNLVYAFKAPISHNGHVIGQLELGLSLTALNSELVSIKKVSAFISLIILVIGMTAVMAMSTVLTRSLTRMVETAESIANGDLTQRADVTSNDELGLLARSFNKMVENLTSAQQELENLNRTLEARVEERTRELKMEIMERKRAEEEIKTHERMYREAIEVADAVPYYLNYISGNYDFIGAGIQAMTGWAEQEFTRETFDSMILDTILLGDLQGLPLQEAVAKARSEKGVSWRVDYHIKTRQGQEKWLNDAAIQVKDEHGSVVGSLGMLQDITERKRNEEELKYRVELEKLITNISTNFINLDAKEIDSAINQALKAIGEFTNVDRSYVFLISDDGKIMNNTHEWCNTGITPQIDNLQNLDVTIIPWWMEKLYRLEHIYIPLVAGLPPEASVEKEILQAQDIQSLIVVPMAYAGALMGFLGFDSVRMPKTWSEVIIDLLKIVGGIFANAVVRKKADEKINAALKENEVMLKEIHHRVKNNLQVICSLLNLQAEHIVDAQAREMFKESQNRVRSMALVHEKLYQSKDLAMVDFAGYIRNLTTELFRSYWPLTSGIDMKANIENVALGIDKAIPCGLMVNELVSNSLKHAFPNGRKGEVIVTVRMADDRHMLLSVRDNGIGLPVDVDIRNTHSLGLQLVCTLSDQIDGTITVDRALGTEFRIVFPSETNEAAGTGKQN